jgi:hypothetical protein
LPQADRGGETEAAAMSDANDELRYNMVIEWSKLDQA